MVYDTHPSQTDPNPPIFPTSLTPSDKAVCAKFSTVQDEGDMEMDDMSGELYDDVSMEGESELIQFLSRMILDFVWPITL